MVGDLIDKRCPRCGGGVVYNGNYSCVDCAWTLSEKADVQPWLRSLIDARRRKGWDTTREEVYLDER